MKVLSISEVPGVVANGLTGIKNLLLDCLFGAISECGGSIFL